MVETYRKKGYNDWPVLNDPLAVSALLDPAILTLEDFHVEIETAGTLTAHSCRFCEIRFGNPVCTLFTWTEVYMGAGGRPNSSKLVGSKTDSPICTYK